MKNFRLIGIPFLCFVLHLLGVNQAYAGKGQVQTGGLEGVVTTSDGQPAAFVSVGLKGTSKGTSTDARGAYSIKDIEPGAYVLLVSFIGLESVERKVEVKAGAVSTVNFSLSESSSELREVVVTSTGTANEKPVTIGKIAIRPRDLPQSVSTIERDVIERQQSLRLSDVLNNTNGVYLMGSTGGYQEEIAGRGFAFSSSNTFKNGVRFNNSAMPEMSSLQRVEVMKGSTAILFGNVAPGGVINLVTRKPLFETGGEITFRVGSYDFYKPSVDVYGALNEKKTAAFRLNTSMEKSASFRDNVKGERFYINPSFLFKLEKKTELLLEGDYLNDDRTADFGVGSINYELIDIPRGRFLGVDWSYYKAEQKSYTITLTHQLNKRWTLRSVTAYQGLSSDLFANQRPNGNSQFIQANGDWIRGLQRTKVDESYYITQLDLSGKFRTGSVSHILLAGVDADKYRTDNLAFTALNRYDTLNVFQPAKFKLRRDIPDLSERTLTSAPIQRAGVYVQDLLSLGAKVKLLLGARYSYLETFSDVLTISSNTNVETKQYDHAVSPRLGIVYQPHTNVSLFASYANSFTPNTGVDINGNALAPSLFDQYEVGVKNDLFRGLLSLNVTAYHLVNSNMAQTSLANGNTNTNIKELAGEVTSRGIEVDVTGKEWKGFSMLAGYSFNDTRYTKSNTYIDGSKLRYNPNHTANASLYYNFRTVKALRGFNIGAGMVYIGERMAGRSTRVNVSNDTYRLIALPAYTGVETSLGYSSASWSVRVKMSNVLNALSYNVHDDNSVNPIAPRQIAATFSYRF